jgi:hypothetical protein
MFIIFFDIKVFVHKEFVLADQPVNSAYCCDVLWRLHKNVKRLCPKLWGQKIWLLHHDNASSHQGNVQQKQHDCRPFYSSDCAPCDFSVSPIVKAAILSHFNCIKMAALNNLMEHDFQHAFKQLHKRWERRIRAKGNYFEL